MNRMREQLDIVGWWAACVGSLAICWHYASAALAAAVVDALPVVPHVPQTKDPWDLFLWALGLLLTFGAAVIYMLVKKNESQHTSLIELHRQSLAQTKEMVIVCTEVKMVVSECTGVLGRVKQQMDEVVGAVTNCHEVQRSRKLKEVA